MQYIGPHQHFTPAACEDPYAQDRQHSPQRSAYMYLRLTVSDSLTVSSQNRELKDYCPIGTNHCPSPLSITARTI